MIPSGRRNCGAPPDESTRVASRAAEVRTLASGRLVGALEMRTGLERGDGAVEVRAVLSLHADSPVLRCTLKLHNAARDHRLRLRIPAGATDT